MEQEGQEAVAEVAALPSPSLLAYPQLDGLNSGMATPPPLFGKPSYYLRQAATRMTVGIVVQTVGSFVGSLMTGANNEGTAMLGLAVTVGAELTGFIMECCAVASLKHAGQALERVHIESNGVAIDL